MINLLLKLLTDWHWAIKVSATETSKRLQTFQTVKLSFLESNSEGFKTYITKCTMEHAFLQTLLNVRINPVADHHKTTSKSTLF